MNTNRIKTFVPLSALSLMVLVAEAQAALPAAVATSVSAIEDDGQAIFDLVFPVIAVLLGLAIVVKLFKRFANKV